VNILRKIQTVLIAVMWWLVVPAHAQQLVQPVKPSSWDYGVPEGRTLFPHDWLRGFTDFEGAPPHNEPDLGRCGPKPLADGAGTSCTAYPRYMISGYLEIQPFGRTFLRHTFVFYQPRFSFGRNVPQISYSASFEPMAYERSVGVGVELPMHFEFRLLQHRSEWLGRYGGKMGATDLTTAGPYGLYSTVGLRWYFGGYGRSRGGANF
jgi:hypothetical protein